MKISTILKKVVPASVFLVVAIHWLTVYAYSNNPPSGYANETGTNCTSCHSKNTLQKNSSRILLTGITSSYSSSTAYHMVIEYPFSTSTSKGHNYGFQVTVLDSATKKSYGTMTVTDKTNTVSSTFSSKTYIGQTSTGSAAAANKQWKFDWTAPALAKSTVAFYVVVNSADHNSSDGGNDTIFAKVFYYRPGAAKPTFNAGFTYSPTTVCQGSPVNFSDTTSGVVTRKWTFKDGGAISTDTAKNTVYTFSNSGTDSAILTDKDASGNISTKRVAITVNAKPGITITANKNPICFGDSVMLTAPIGTLYSWSNGSSTASIYVKDSSVSYTVNVTNSSGCSSTSVPYKITINPPAIAPSLSASKDTICSGDKVTITATSGMSSYKFMEGTTVLSTGMPNNFGTSSLSVGSHNITVIGTNSSGCTSPSSKSITIYVSAPPTVNLTANQGGKYCFGNKVVLTATSGLSSYVFNKNKSILSSGALNTTSFNASTISAGDVFNVTVTNASGCKATSSDVTLNYAPKLHPGFTYINKNGTVTFTDTTKGNMSRVWDFGDKTATDTNMNPVHTYKTKNTYPVKLIVFNANGCTDTFVSNVGVIITGIEQPISINNARVYPNPAQSHLNVAINSVSDQNVEIIIHDMQGHKVLRQKVQISEGENTVSLSLEGIAAGTYILQLKGKEEVKYFGVMKSE